MTPERWQHVKDLFHSALEHDPATRMDYLRRICPDDPALTREVRKLLAADGEPGNPLEEPISAVAARLLTCSWSEQYIGQQIGPYRIVREIGRGGMGAVYQARRDDGQYEEEVAIKLIKRGMDTDAIIDRFRRERQILASLDHPNIARLLGGGMNEEGLPYFVMEYIEGIPIDRYCDQHKLPTVERIKLFRVICSAVGAAHGSMVVHCDLKPDNILVTADALPKLVDFGIAKLLDPDHVPSALTATVNGQRLMTPNYASPEQLRGQPITVASDVYALGVMLYELLTGRRPYRFESQLRREIEEVICKIEPEKPSTVVRRTELQRRLKGDLDKIVLKAIRKEPAERYRSVDHLSDDLKRYLKGLPVLARQATLGYRTRKFIRRNWLGVAAATAVLLSLMAGIAMTTWQAQVARTERATAERTLDFLVGLFRASAPGENRTLTVREVLDRGALRIEQELENEPEAQATLMDAIGVVYYELGFYDEAEPLLVEALKMHRMVLGLRHPKVAVSVAHLGRLRYRQTRFSEAESLLREALASWRDLTGDESVKTADSMSDLGTVLKARGKFQEAELLLRQALDLQHRLLGKAHPEIASVLNSLGMTRLAQGDFKEAEALTRSALEMRRSLLGSDHPDVIASLNNVALIERRTGDYENAQSLYREALERGKRVFSEEHPYVAKALNNLALLLKVRSEYEAAESLFLEALQIQRERLQPNHSDIASTLNNLAALYSATGAFEEAERLYGEALDIRLEHLDEEHPDITTTYGNLASLYYKQAEYEKSIVLFRKVHATNQRTLGKDHPDNATDMENLALALGKTGAFAEAEGYLLESLALNRKRVGLDHPKVAKTLLKLGRLMKDQKDFDSAEVYLHQSLEILGGIDGLPQDSPISPSNERAVRIRVLTNLCSLYKLWNAAENAELYCGQLEGETRS